jgi:hypothetical protein
VINVNCPVCLNPLTNGFTARLSCDHLLCTRCVETWASGGQANNLSCPICRTQFATRFGGGYVGGYGAGLGQKPMPFYVVVTRPGLGLGALLPDN